MRPSGSILWIRNERSGSIKVGTIFWLAEQVLAAQDVFCCIDLSNYDVSEADVVFV
jgi:hypothetical protein